MGNSDKVFPGLRGMQTAGLILGIAGLGMLGYAYSTGDKSVFQSYLLGFVVWLMLSLGFLGITILKHLTQGTWGNPIIKFTEAGAKTLLVMGLLFIPLVMIGLADVYPWADAAKVEASKVLQYKAPYFEITFFAIRAFMYFAIWVGIAFLLSKWSKEHDETGNFSLFQKRTNFSAVAMVFFVLTVTFAATDWVMSLEEHWFSTIYGFWFVIGGSLFALALSTYYLVRSSNRWPFSALKTKINWRDLGNLNLALVVLWAYMSFSQFIIIWSGNLPEEITYYLDRQEGNWMWVGAGLIFLHFLLPFFLLLSTRLKTTPNMLGNVAVFVCLMRVGDVIWAVVPSLHRSGASFVWTDAVAIIGIGGIWLFSFLWMFRSGNVLPSYAAIRAEHEEALQNA